MEEMKNEKTASSLREEALSAVTGGAEITDEFLCARVRAVGIRIASLVNRLSPGLPAEAEGSGVSVTKLSGWITELAEGHEWDRIRDRLPDLRFALDCFLARAQPDPAAKTEAQTILAKLDDVSVLLGLR